MTEKAEKAAGTRGDKRRAEILRTALTLFNAHGTSAVSTNHIAKELGISVGNLYYHFADKETIVRELYADQIQQFDGMWQAFEELGLFVFMHGATGSAVHAAARDYTLNTVIGYERATELAKEAAASGRGILELVRDRHILTDRQIADVLDPMAMTGQTRAV